MKILNKKILNKAATFLLMAVLLCWNAVQVEAYTDLNGYPWYSTQAPIVLYTDAGYYTTIYNSGVIEQNSMRIYNNSHLTGLKVLTLSDSEMSFVLPYNPDLYDYWVVGTIAATEEYGETNLQFKGINVGNYNQSYMINFSDENTMTSFNSDEVSGYSFWGKIYEPVEDCNFCRFQFIDSSGQMSLGGDVFVSISFVPIAKDSTLEDVNASILQELIKINQNLVTSNSLQQSTIDAINQHDANEKSWFQQLIQNMGLGFSALYKQMTEEKDEQLYGYQDTTTSEAASAFSSESDRLTALEGELSTQSNTYVTDYAAEGFDLGVWATIGSSLICVTTWFTNFWNIGGVFTACLNFCFALSIVFFILRIKR